MSRKAFPREDQNDVVVEYSEARVLYLVVTVETKQVLQRKYREWDGRFCSHQASQVASVRLLMSIIRLWSSLRRMVCFACAFFCFFLLRKFLSI